MANCKKCGKQTMLMSGMIYLQPDSEPYESGKEEPSREGIMDIDRYTTVQFCEECDEIKETYNE